VRGLTYRGPELVSVVEVPDPKPPDEFGAVVRVHAAGICGSDLHIYHGHGFSPDIGYCLGHEAVGTVAAVGSRVETFAVGDRVLWGVGVDSSIVTASLRAVVSAINRASR